MDWVLKNQLDFDKLRYTLSREKSVSKDLGRKTWDMIMNSRLN